VDTSAGAHSRNEAPSLALPRSDRGPCPRGSPEMLITLSSGILHFAYPHAILYV
jgi:hypothetical protein